MGEKSNYFLENMIDLVEEPLESRIVDYLMEAPVNDGGQWGMATNLVVKYGVVPKALFPESFTSSNTGRFKKLITYKLRKYALELRDLRAETPAPTPPDRPPAPCPHPKGTPWVVSTLRTRKEAQTEEIYGMLCIAYGEPPAPGCRVHAGATSTSAGKFHNLGDDALSNSRLSHTGSFTAKGIVLARS
ncbi:unnamed protein product [Tilletia controversa]|uniref:Uncharacterized protein n=3 Tax=Tilletia TaxID=13289 RepID=A0A8X7SWU2_9BASI|nr:hypothetical protein CF336_g7646 [Tilletia laevis]KAE8186022.1 hypothetical protein CF328_g7364 [Tilletia controversa]KAE8247029.1 hypothetical protein A4X03_0g7163 [Tilletia caries]KAE8187494.1 hypothetical protein CF335_g7155 [Tilletia laevis]KAE8247160.1 hypothetical protein A4X06_0g4659 [Tilletia controversa]